MKPPFACLYLHLCLFIYLEIYVYMCTQLLHNTILTALRRMSISIRIFMNLYINIQIIFHKRANKYRSLLWKMTYKDKGSYYIYTHIYEFVYTYVHLYIHMCTCTLYQYRVAKTRRIPYLYRSFSAKVTYIYWLFCVK